MADFSYPDPSRQNRKIFGSKPLHIIYQPIRNFILIIFEIQTKGWTFCATRCDLRAFQNRSQLAELWYFLAEFWYFCLKMSFLSCHYGFSGYPQRILLLTSLLKLFLIHDHSGRFQAFWSIWCDLRAFQISLQINGIVVFWFKNVILSRLLRNAGHRSQVAGSRSALNFSKSVLISLELLN